MKQKKNGLNFKSIFLFTFFQRKYVLAFYQKVKDGSSRMIVKEMAVKMNRGVDATILGTELERGSAGN